MISIFYSCICYFRPPVFDSRLTCRYRCEIISDETEFLERRIFPFEKALHLALKGEIMDIMSILGLLLAARCLGK